MFNMTKLSLPMVAIGLGMALFASESQAASTVGGASATIAAPISISETASLSFGSVTTSAALGTVVITSAGVRSVTGGVGQLGGTPGAAAFSVAGEGTATYAVSLPTSTSLTGTGAPMTVDGINITGATSRSLSGGADSFTLGATLHVNASQVSGSYSGSYTVSVNYN